MSYEKQTWAAGDTISGAKLNHIEEGVEGINMSYEKTTWQSGDTITAEKLNNIEDGIAGAGGGDVTTAEVTLVLLNPIFSAAVPIAIDYVDPEYPEDNYSAVTVETTATNGTYKVPLYKGHCYIDYTNSSTLVGTGDVSIVQGITTLVDVFGDCTITETN